MGNETLHHYTYSYSFATEHELTKQEIANILFDASARVRDMVWANAGIDSTSHNTKSLLEMTKVDPEPC